MSRALLCVCAAVIAFAHQGHANEEATATPETSSPVTVTPAGVIRGSWMTTRRGRRFQAYRGVRYAHPPTGEMRFQPPQPILHYPAEVDAREEGPACPQQVYRAGFVVDEDCLRVNVYTPRSNGSMPVLVFLHPGGYYSGSGRSDVAGPHYLMDRDLVFVTVEHRLGSLGFLSTGDEVAPGNNGFKDQVEALRWVQRNIAAFGGDPNCVTIAGYSAGSRTVALMMLSPMTQGLFHRAISMSASPTSQVVVGNHQRHLAEKQARLLGCPTNTTRDMVDCLQTKSGKEFADTVDSMFEFGYDPVLLWNVVVEPDCGQERFLIEPPLQTILAGRLHAVPYMIGRNTNEFFWKAFNILNNATLYKAMSTEWERVAPISFLLPRQQPAPPAGHVTPAAVAARRLKDAYFRAPFANDSATAEALGTLYADSITGFAVHRMANLMCRRSSQAVYYYQFAYIGNNSYRTDPVTKKPLGVAHHDELIYLFTLPTRFPAVELGSRDDVMVDRMTGVWYNFARYGDPNPHDVTDVPPLQWPRMRPPHPQYLYIDTQVEVKRDMFQERYAVWDELYSVRYD